MIKYPWYANNWGLLMATAIVLLPLIMSLYNALGVLVSAIGTCWIWLINGYRLGVSNANRKS